jgi:HD superfamily phosphohydrolase YqeK
MAFEIFVSYRSGDRDVANAITTRMQDSWGYDLRVWQDRERLQAGAPWASGIDTGLRRAELVVAVIGKAWLRPQNLTRLFDTEDYVRRELADALAADKPVLPVLIDGLPIPPPGQLPSELRPMLDVEWARISSALTSRDRRTLIGCLSRAGQPPPTSAEPWIYDRSELAPAELLAGVQAHLETWAVDGGCRVRAVLGPDGTGRTALLERLRAAPPTGALTALHLVRDAEAAPVPYRTAVHWFRELIAGIDAMPDRHLRERAGRALFDALRTSGTDLLATNGLVDRSQLVQVSRGLDDLAETSWGARTIEFPPRHLRRQIIGVISELSKVVPVLLLVDDLHRLDDASVDLLTDLRAALRGPTDPAVRLALVIAGPLPTADDEIPECLAALPSDPAFQASCGISTIGDDHEPARILLDVVTRGGRVKVAADLQQWLCRQGYTPFLAVVALRRLNDEELLADDPDAGWQLAPRADEATHVPEHLDERSLLAYLLENEVPDLLIPTLEVGALLGLTFSFDLTVAVLGELHRGNGPDADDLWRELRSNDLDCMVYRCFADPSRAISFAHGSFPASLVQNLRPARLDAVRAAIAAVLRGRLDAADRAEWTKQLVDWSSLAAHLTAAKRSADAAHAYVQAGELSARALADHQAIRYYEQAHQLYEELLASVDGGPAAPERLLSMAHCDVQKARLLRIGNRDGTPNLDQAERHLDHVDGHLRAGDLERGEPTAAIRDLLTGAEAGIDRRETYRRLVHAQRGEVALERGRHRLHDGDLATAEMELLSALRHAEDSPPIPARRQLIDAASADLARTLVMKVRRRRHMWHAATTHAVARDALFHIARVVAFAPLPSRADPTRTGWAASPPPGTAAAARLEAVVDALTTQGRLHHTVHRDVMLATRCFEHALDAVGASTVALDHGTLLAKAMLELAVADATRDAGALVQARTSLADYRRRAAEIGSARHLALADLGVAMAECAEGGSTSSSFRLSRDDVDDITTLTAAERRRLCLFAGLLSTLHGTAVSHDVDGARGDAGRWFEEYATAGDGLRAALWEFADELPRCVGTWAGQLWNTDDAGLVAWTAEYCTSLATSQVEYLHPALEADQLVRRLAGAFLDEPGLDHARRVETLATALVDHHARDDEATQLRRDVSIAAHLHDWFRELPMSRVQSLARDWDLPVNGVEWANPQLLHGPLAAELLTRQLRGSELLGDIHFHRIRSMVKNHTVGCSDDDGPIAFADAAFFLADCQAALERRSGQRLHPAWMARALEPDGWRAALDAVRAQKVRDLQAAGVTLHPRSTTVAPDDETP